MIKHKPYKCSAEYVFENMEITIWGYYGSRSYKHFKEPDDYRILDTEGASIFCARIGGKKYAIFVWRDKARTVTIHPLQSTTGYENLWGSSEDVREVIRDLFGLHGLHS